MYRKEFRTLYTKSLAWLSLSNGSGEYIFSILFIHWRNIYWKLTLGHTTNDSSKLSDFLMHYFRAGGNYLIHFFWKVIDAQGTKFKVEKDREWRAFFMSDPRSWIHPTQKYLLNTSFSHILSEIFHIYRSICGLTRAFPLVEADSSFFCVSVCEDQKTLAKVPNKKHQASVESFIRNIPLCLINHSQPHTIIIVNSSKTRKLSFCRPTFYP